ncbi:hypothetical protein KCU81_g61, partial [Aureobasidium melanogenum]
MGLCDSGKHRDSAVLAAYLRGINSTTVVTRQAMLAAVREFSPNPNAARPIEQLQQATASCLFSSTAALAAVPSMAFMYLPSQPDIRPQVVETYPQEL